MDWKKEFKPLTVIVAVFLIFYYLPIDSVRFKNGLLEAVYLTQWYAREHVLLCLVPAFFIAGAIAVFVGKNSVMKYLGARANKVLAYGVASVSGSILAVCSCTVLPLFAGIYRMGAGLGPATAFLYAGPAINVLAIILTARVLGLQLGIARAVGAILFSIVIGLFMHFIFRREESEKAAQQMVLPEEEISRPLWQTGLYFAAMVAVLIFANWGKPNEVTGLWNIIYNYKWLITGIAASLLAVMLVVWFAVKWWKILIVALPVLILAIVLPDLPIIAFSAAIIGLSIITST
ncbi:MAG: permease, partial [candidate division Zixibacteria bacterium]|nr:permease [candidate division Zixibacteria bacterium]